MGREALPLVGLVDLPSRDTIKPPRGRTMHSLQPAVVPREPKALPLVDRKRCPSWSETRCPSWAEDVAPRGPGRVAHRGLETLPLVGGDALPLEGRKSLPLVGRADLSSWGVLEPFVGRLPNFLEPFVGDPKTPRGFHATTALNQLRAF